MTIQGTIDEIQFRPGEQESIRVQKLALVLTKLLDALGVTTDDAIAAIAALTPAADRYIYFTSATAASLGTITAFGRSLLDDADAAAAQTTIGYTAADVLSKLLTVDGSGSLLDADTLDGANGTFFLARANHTGTQTAATISDFSTAADARVAAAVGVSVQAFDADLSALAALSGTNTLYYRSAANTWTAVTIGGLLTFSGGTLNVGDATLVALGAYNTNGMLTQTAADTFTGRTITGTANEITATNGSGVSGNPTLSLPTALTFTGKTVTGGTFNTLAGLTVAANVGPLISAPTGTGTSRWAVTGPGDTLQFGVLGPSYPTTFTWLTAGINYIYASGGISIGGPSANWVTLFNNEIHVNGTRVVTTQKAALPADATDLATVITLTNAIKARLKTTGGHGLVAD